MVARVGVAQDFCLNRSARPLRTLLQRWNFLQCAVVLKRPFLRNIGRRFSSKRSMANVIALEITKGRTFDSVKTEYLPWL